MVVPLSLHADTRLHRTLLSRFITTFSTPHVPQYKYLQIIEQKYKSKEIFTRISTFIFIKTLVTIYDNTLNLFCYLIYNN